MVKGLKKLPYEIRLQRLGIYTLERRRLHGDLIETFKIFTGKERIDYKKFFELADATSWLRVHSLKLYKPRCHTRLRQNFFSVRVINEWNKLPQSVIEAPSVNAFKNRLDKYWSYMGDYSRHGYTTHQPQVQVQETSNQSLHSLTINSDVSEDYHLVNTIFRKQILIHIATGTSGPSGMK